MPRILLSYEADCARQVEQLLAGEPPVFLSRLGGSDTDLIVDFFRLTRTLSEDETLASLAPQIDLVRHYNGYYDRANDPKKVARYCHVMREAYTGCSEVCLAGAVWLSAYLPDSIDPQFYLPVGEKKAELESFLRSVAPPFLRLYPYSFIERVLLGETLFGVLARALRDQRVLVACPFARSIHANFHRRHEFFPGYAYPDFSLVTLNTPITYAGLPDAFYPHADWFETLEALKSALTEKEFDIALLACGSYAMPLGRFIADRLRRKAVYVGGVLQLLFGILGRRYENPFFLNQINREAFVYPLEREEILRYADIRPESAKEALGAYF